MMSLFYGVVEDRNDPLKLGRVRVRVMGIHTDKKSEIPTDDLHWAIVALPTTSASVSGVSDTPKLVEGSHVVLSFLDDEYKQQPIVLFSIPGIPTKTSVTSLGFNDPRKDLDVSNNPGIPSDYTYPSD